MSELISIFRTVFNVLKQPSGLASIIIDVLIIMIFLYKVLEWTRETRAYQVMKGIGLLFVVSILARLFGLTTVSWILDSILASGTIFLILFILFTPELRRVSFQDLRSRCQHPGNKRDPGHRRKEVESDP